MISSVAADTGRQSKIGVVRSAQSDALCNTRYSPYSHIGTHVRQQ
jgi:hypothetical protein